MLCALTYVDFIVKYILCILIPQIFFISSSLWTMQFVSVILDKSLLIIFYMSCNEKHLNKSEEES